MEGIQTLKGSWPWPSIRPYGISSCSSHRPLPMYQLSFKLKKLFVDGRTYGRTDILPLYTIRSTFGSRPKKHSSRKRMQQSKKHKVTFFWILKTKTLKKCKKKRNSNDMQRFRDHSISFCPVNVSIKSLRPYFNRQFYIVSYVYVIVCCFGAHSVS